MDWVEITYIHAIKSINFPLKLTAPLDTAQDPLLLPAGKCQHALDEIRRTKWFSVKLKPIANAMLVLRVMRDFCRRTPTWFVLDDWLLELVVEKCFVRNKYEKVPLKFRAIFESLSSGMLFLPELSGSTGLELVEPCRQESVFAKMTAQQKEDLTASAQHALRLIAFKRIGQILALDAAEANLLFSSTTSSDKVVAARVSTDESQRAPDVAADLDSKLNLMSQPENKPTTESTTTGEPFAYEQSQNFSENINNISMFILNNYASNIFDLCFNFLDLSNLQKLNWRIGDLSWFLFYVTFF